MWDSKALHKALEAVIAPSIVFPIRRRENGKLDGEQYYRDQTVFSVTKYSRVSNANSLVNFSAGVHDVFCSPNAHKSILYPFDSFDLTLSGSLIVPLDATVQGNLKTFLSASFGAVTASHFKGEGSQITGVNALSSSFASVVPASGITAGTMSGNFFIDGNVSIPGTASVAALITIYTSSSIIFQSGSTKFGDSSDDTHQLTGSLLVLGNSNLNGNVTASSFKGDGTQVTNVVSASFAGTDWSVVNNKPVGLLSASAQLNTGSFLGTFSGSVTGAAFFNAPSNAIVSGTALILDYASISGPNTVLEGRRGGVTRWGIGFSAADVFAILNAAKTTPNFVLTDTGNASIEGTITSTGSISTRANLIALGTASVGLFSGSGQQLTGVISSSFAGTDWGVINNRPIGLVSSSTQISTGSFQGGFTGSLLGSASIATTASAANSLTYTPYIYITPNVSQRDYLLKNSWVSYSGSAAIQWKGLAWAPEIGTLVSVASTGTGNRVMTSKDGKVWASQSSSADFNWIGVVWAPELRKFVSVATNGTARVMTSPDGITWSLQNHSVANAWQNLCWSPELRLFVAVANTGTNDQVMTSPDGITWTTRTSAITNTWIDICWSPELRLFVAVANGATTTDVMTSPDGITWATRTTATGNSWFSVCWSRELRLFVAVATAGSNQVMTSPDGITWTTRTAATTNSWRKVVWSSELGIFLAVSSTGTGDRVMSSPDGITWTSRTSSTNDQWFALCWIPQLNTFCAVGIDGAGVMLSPYSSYGINIPSGSIPNLTGSFQGIFTGSFQGIFTGSLLGTASFVPTASLALIAASASAATTFSVSDVLLVPNGTAARPGIAFMSDSGSGFFYPGPGNGLRWIASGVAVLRLETSALMLDNGDLRGRNGSVTAPSIAFINDATSGLYTLGGSAGNWGITSAKTSSIVFSTSNVEIALPLSASKGITGSLLGSASFVATSSAATSVIFPSGYALTSSYLTSYSPQVPNVPVKNFFVSNSWSSPTYPQDNSWFDICWAKELGLFVAVAIDGTNQLMTSNDGASWTVRNAPGPTNKSWNSIAWSPELGRFVGIVSDNFGIFMTSTDGITWTGISGSQSNALSSVVWSPELRKFVAVGFNGSRVQTSPDGITWTTLSSVTGSLAISWNSVVWSPQLRLFVAGATTGGSGSIMTSPDGTNWTQRIIPDNIAAVASGQPPRSISWSPELGLFAAVRSGTTGSVLTSPDGINWTIRNTSASAAMGLQTITWSSELGTFLALPTSAGGSDKLVVSPDGITWSTSSFTVPTNTWNAICWAPEVGKFVAVAQNGTGNRVLNSPISTKVFAYKDVSGSWYATGSVQGRLSLTGSLLGTASVATTAISADSASYINPNGVVSKTSTGQFLSFSVSGLIIGATTTGQANPSLSINRKGITDRGIFYYLTDGAVEWEIGTIDPANSSDLLFGMTDGNGNLIESVRFVKNTVVEPLRTRFSGSANFVSALTGSKFATASTGSAASVGDVTLVAGSRFVTSSVVTSGSYVMMNRKTIGGTVGNTSYVISASTGFAVSSSSATDTSTYSWWIINGI
jgi:hypothetical protein